MGRLLSVSALQTWWACPRLYAYRYELQVPSLSLETSSSQQGSWIHAQLHQHTTQAALPELASDPQYAALWQVYLKAIEPFATQQVWSEWACHVPLTLPAETLWLTGRLDRIYLDPLTRQVTLLDWKTGQGSPSESTALQLELYAWLLWRAQSLLSAEPLAGITARALWLNQAGLEQTQTWLPADFEALEARLQQLVAPLSPARTEPLARIPRPRSVGGRVWCTMCEYQRLCPEGQYHA